MYPSPRKPLDSSTIFTRCDARNIVWNQVVIFTPMYWVKYVDATWTGIVCITANPRHDVGHTRYPKWDTQWKVPACLGNVEKRGIKVLLDTE